MMRKGLRCPITPQMFIVEPVLSLHEHEYEIRSSLSSGDNPDYTHANHQEKVWNSIFRLENGYVVACFIRYVPQYTIYFLRRREFSNGKTLKSEVT